ncbi:uncharacterized protein LOC143892576 [Tasmannia lanceolata]|uniref:uncharacterized protein LOC143892576 n=1 Tax=Tasmannia lanceolata TaxID=3420 RepID=UPI004062C2BF
MKMGIIAFFVALLISMVHVNARTTFVLENPGKHVFLENAIFLHGSTTMDSASEKDVPFSEELPPEFICYSCLDVSRKVEQILTDPKVLEKFVMLSADVCNLLPSDIQVKCIQMSEMYIHQAVLFLQEYFSEESLCNSTGLCSENAKVLLMSSNGTEKQISANKISDERTCKTCRDAIDELRNDLDNPEKQIKVIRFLLKACENAKNHVRECKKLVFEYGPLVLANLDKYLSSNDLCHMLHICDAVEPRTLETFAIDA